MTSITVLAKEGPVALGFDDLVRYHGHAALPMLAITFRVQEAAFRRLLPGEPPARAAISVTSGHPGPGVRDAFEMVARCVTRGAYTVDRSLPGPRLLVNRRTRNGELGASRGTMNLDDFARFGQLVSLIGL